MGMIAFDYVEKGEPMTYAVKLALSMTHFKTPEDIKHLISHPYFSEDYKPKNLVKVV